MSLPALLLLAACSPHSPNELATVPIVAHEEEAPPAEEVTDVEELPIAEAQTEEAPPIVELPRIEGATVLPPVNWGRRASGLAAGRYLELEGETWALTARLAPFDGPGIVKASPCWFFTGPTMKDYYAPSSTGAAPPRPEGPGFVERDCEGLMVEIVSTDVTLRRPFGGTAVLRLSDFTAGDEPFSIPEEMTVKSYGPKP